MSYDEDKSTSAIEADIERTRARLDDTLGALERRLAPGALLDDGLDYLRRSGAREYVANLGETAKRDPMPLALVGVGLAWLMLSNGRERVDTRPASDAVASGIDGAKTTLRSAGDNVRSTAAGVRDKVADVGQKVAGVRDKVAQSTRDVAQRVSDSADAAKAGANRLGDAARDSADRVRGAFDRMVNEQPLALGAIGLALGAMVAAAAPRTRSEDRLVGSTSDRLKDDVKESGREQLEKVKVAATEATDSVLGKESTPQGRSGGEMSPQSRPSTQKEGSDAWSGGDRGAHSDREAGNGSDTPASIGGSRPQTSATDVSQGGLGAGTSGMPHPSTPPRT